MTSTLKTNDGVQQSHQKAAWLKLSDGDEKEEKKEEKQRRTIKGIYKRNDAIHRKTPDGSATMRNFHTENLGTKSSSQRPKSVSARIESGTDWVGADIVGHKQSTRGHHDSNIDLDFADKIKAFRSLIKTNHKVTSGDERTKSYSVSNEVRTQGGHVKFNSKSLEGRAPAQNEFQLTYEQDKYLMNKRNGLDTAVTIEKEHYSSVYSNSYNNTHDEIVVDNKDPEMSSNKMPSSRVIKRPNSFSHIQNDKEPQITSILKHSRNNQIRDSIAHTDLTTKQSRGDREFNEYRHESDHIRVSKPSSSEISSYGVSSPLSFRPASVSDMIRSHSRSHSTHGRPRSANTVITGRAHSSVGSISPSTSFSTRKDPITSLQTHLNALGASLSSLSSIVNGDSNDNTLEHADYVGRHIESPSTIITAGRSSRFDHSDFLTDSHRRGGKSPSSATSIERHYAMSPSSDYSGASIHGSIQGSVSRVNHRLEMARPRSDDYFVLDRFRHKAPSSPRVKQTNVRGVEEDGDSILSPREDKSGLYSVSSSSRVELSNSHDIGSVQNDSSIVLSKRDLRHYVRRVSRERDTLADYSSYTKGAGRVNNESITSHSSRLKEEKLRVQNSRRTGTQTSLSDYSDEDTLVNETSVVSSSNRESRRVSKNGEHSKSPERPKIISRHKAANNARQAEKRDGHTSPSIRDPKNGHVRSTSGASKSLSAASGKSKTIDQTRIIRRPGGSPSLDEERKGDKTPSRKASHTPSDRSQTALGLSTNKDLLKKYAILPSKYNSTETPPRQRPHSALEGTALSGKKVKNGRTAELMNKIQNLHKEVDERLKSDKNKSHSVTSSLSDLFEMANNDSDEGPDFISGLKSSHLLGRNSKGGDTKSKTKVVIRRKNHHEPEVDIESGSDRERFSCASENFVSSSTPRKREVVSSQNTQTRRIRGEFDDNTRTRRLVSNTDSDDVDSVIQKTKDGHHKMNDRIESVSKPRGLPDKLRNILFSGSRSPYVSRYDNDSMSDRSRKERDREGFDDDKDEDDTVNEEYRSWHRGVMGRPSSAPIQSSESKGRAISPFIKRLAYVDVSSHEHAGGRRPPLDINKIVSGRASPADVLMGYLDNPNTVRLLQKLYQADPIDREIIMIKVLYFKAWSHFSTTSKQKRLRKETLLECADTFCYQRILGLHFIVWAKSARYSRNTRRASALCRRHMLSKGFRALRWSVSHSRHCKELIQTRYRMLATRASFDVWRNKAVKQRRERMENTWQRWKQFVTEVHKIRHMQNLMDKNITERVYTYWRKCYDKHMKQRMAFNYFRHTLYKHTFHSWSAFVSTCKQKKDKYLSAVSQYQNNLVKTTFFQIVFAYKKSKKARNHFRKQKLNEVFWSWKEASKICRNERQHDLAISVEHCKIQTTKRRFRQWKQRMLLRKADVHANSHLYRNTFNRWIKSYHEQFTKRLEIEAALERNKLHRTLLTWRQNVVQIQRRHKKAVALIERCFLRSTLATWRIYVGTKIGTRNRVLRHQKHQERKSVNIWFCLWLDKYRARLDNKKRQLLWSHSCARNVFNIWRHICHRRYLERRLDETQPDRELRFLQTIFTRWVISLEKRRAEEEEADIMKKNLEKRNLQSYLQTWRTATQKQLLIKPLIEQKGQTIMAGCFNGWRRYIRSNVDCRTSRLQVIKIRTKKYFGMWRRQFVAHKVEKRIMSQFSQGLLLCCFDEWKLFVQLKKRGYHFRHKRLVTTTFSFWKNAAALKESKRIMLKAEETNNLQLKRECFVAWWECVQQEKSTADACVVRLSEVRDRSVLLTAFGEWKRLLHSTLIARAYQKMFHQRLTLTLLLEWRAQVNDDVHSAVSVFQEKIGLAENNNDPRYSRGLSSSMKEDWNNSMGMESEVDTALQGDENMKMSYSASLSSSFTAGLFSRLLDENSSIDSDTDRSFLLSGGLQDAAISHQARCSRMKEIASTAIWRLRHWPTCVAFQQWQEFTESQIQLKKASKQVKTLVDDLETALAFRQWGVAFVMMKKSRQHRDHHLMSSTLATLQQNTKHCRHVKFLAARSEKHLKLKVFSQYFPIWLRKTQKQRREKHAITLWTSSTTEEMELYPLEHRLTSKLNDRTLRLCFSLWLVKFSLIQKIRHVYHTNTLQWVFTAWREWASCRHNLVKKSTAMTCKRRVKMAFRRWCEKYHQSKQTAMLYQQAWHNYQTQIFMQWHLWAKASRKRRNLLDSFRCHNSHRKMASCFTTWKSLTTHALVIQGRQRIFHLHNAFKEWCLFVNESKTKKQIMMQFQIRSYTLLVKRLFQYWYSAMVHQRTVQEERVQEAERKALHYGRVWRRRCQTQRGKHLERIFQHRQVSIYLQTWQLRYSTIQLLHERLDDFQRRKNGKLTRFYLQNWVLALKGRQMGIDYTGKLLHTIVWEWRLFTKESRERRKRGIALTKALQERSLHVYFQFWVAITKVKMSVRYNAETKLQMRIMRSWHHYARHKTYLRQVQTHVTQRVQGRILSEAFTKLRWRTEYCNNLQEVADKILQDRVRATLTAVLVLWKQRLDHILADRCYGGILVVRVVRQWHRFVHKRKSEREKEMADHLKAVHIDQKLICKRALAGLKELVLVSRMASKRRQRLCDKYAIVWKTRVDLQISAMEMEWDLLCWKTWRRWRSEFVQRQSAKRIERDSKRHTLSQAFKCWRKLCKPSLEMTFYQAITPKTDRRVSSTSQLPVPKGRGFTPR